MKRYLVFIYSNWYPRGAESDFICSKDTLIEAQNEFMEATLEENCDILDTQLGEWICGRKTKPSSVINWEMSPVKEMP